MYLQKIKMSLYLQHSNFAMHYINTTHMLQQFQIEMLAAAAKQKGLIAQIFVTALDMGDVDTVEYIIQHYATTKHFTKEQITYFAVISEDIALYRREQQHATIH